MKPKEQFREKTFCTKKEKDLFFFNLEFAFH